MLEFRESLRCLKGPVTPGGSSERHRQRPMVVRDHLVLRIKAPPLAGLCPEDQGSLPKGQRSFRLLFGAKVFSTKAVIKVALV
jgi:hypothetical protein